MLYTTPSMPFFLNDEEIDYDEQDREFWRGFPRLTCAVVVIIGFAIYGAIEAVMRLYGLF